MLSMLVTSPKEKEEEGEEHQHRKCCQSDEAINECYSPEYASRATNEIESERDRQKTKKKKKKRK